MLIPSLNTLFEHFRYSSKPAQPFLFALLLIQLGFRFASFCILSILVIATSIDQTFYFRSHRLDSRHGPNRRREQENESPCHALLTSYRLLWLNLNWLLCHLIDSCCFIPLEMTRIKHGTCSCESHITSMLSAVSSTGTHWWLREYSSSTRIHAEYSLNTRILAEYASTRWIAR